MPRASTDSDLVLAIFEDGRFYTLFQLVPRGARLTRRGTCPGRVLARVACTQSDGRRLLRRAARKTVDGVTSLGITYDWDGQMVSFGGRYSLDDDCGDLCSDEESANPVQRKPGRAWWYGDRVSSNRRAARSDAFYVSDSSSERRDLKDGSCERRNLENEIGAQVTVAFDALQRAVFVLAADNTLRDRLCRGGISVACGAGWLLA